MSASPVSLVSAETVSVSFGRDPVLDRVSLGISAGDRIGVVGRNGGGKSTLISVLTGRLDPQSGRVATMRGLRTDLLTQADELDSDSTVRAAVLGEDADHVWAAERQAREVVEHVLAGIELDRLIGPLSGGERRRVALAALLVRDQDLLVLDEPTNHLDIEMISWLADHLNARFAGPRGRGLVVVTHDRWFLDAICDQTWEVHDGTVSAYEGGYAAYVLARAERDRQAAASAAKRVNLVRKELAWLRRGPPARTSKPKFRIDAATALIDDEPPARDSLALTRLAGSRLGKKVFDIEDVTLRLGERVLLDDVTARFGPGERVGVLGPNGAGKTSLLRLFTGELTPDAGGLQRGSTVRIGVLGQGVGLERPTGTPLSLVEGVARVATSDGGEVGGTSLLERFGFTGDRLTTPIAQLSGGEQRRLQILRVLLAAPNVLLLDEPTNDLDIDSLTVLEDFLDTWPGTVFVVSHDRYFLERTCDTIWTLPGDGSFRLLTRGVEGYLEERRGRTGVAAARSVSDPDLRGSSANRGSDNGSRLRGSSSNRGSGPSPAELRQAKKTLAKLDRQLESLARAEQRVHDRMIEHATDGEQIIALDVELRELATRRARVEESWLVAAEAAGS